MGAARVDTVNKRAVLLQIGLLGLVFAFLPAFAAQRPAQRPTNEDCLACHSDSPMTKDANGLPSFTIASGSKTYGLEAGPPWFWGANNPLAKFAGKSVTITGETSAGSTDVDVLTVDGTAIRAPGRPPWAGGWKAVGSKHPGWSQEKADKFKAKFGDCFPPGQCKKTDTAPAIRSSRYIRSSILIAIGSYSTSPDP